MHANCKIVRLLSSGVVCPPPSPGPLAENADLAERCCCWSHSIIFTAGRGSVQGGDVVIINQVTCRYEDTWHVWSMHLHSTSIHLAEHGIPVFIWLSTYNLLHHAAIVHDCHVREVAGRRQDSVIDIWHYGVSAWGEQQCRLLHVFSTHHVILLLWEIVTQ